MNIDMTFCNAELIDGMTVGSMKLCPKRFTCGRYDEILVSSPLMPYLSIMYAHYKDGKCKYYLQKNKRDGKGT